MAAATKRKSAATKRTGGRETSNPATGGRPEQVGQPLEGRVAVVAGATRGTGRGIARALGEAGAIVYCTGRSIRGNPSPYGRPETIEETADLVTAAGGAGIAVRVDHTIEAEVRALFRRVESDHGRLDLLVNSVAGEDPLLGGWTSFWETDLSQGAETLRQTILSHLITTKHAAAIMVRKRRGLIVEVTAGDTVLGGAGGNVLGSDDPPREAIPGKALVAFQPDVRSTATGCRPRLEQP